MPQSAFYTGGMKFCISLLFLFTATACAAPPASNYFWKTVYLSDHYLAVIAEVPFEPRSIGSYSVRLYHVGNPEFPYDDFRNGVIAARDGSLESITLHDTNQDNVKEIAVHIRSAGTGNFLSVDRYEIRNGRIEKFTP
ncbi:MAG: PliI family lysozyme inhibitor of I-type lysozyme [Sneathiella sp.]